MTLKEELIEKLKQDGVNYKERDEYVEWECEVDGDIYIEHMYFYNLHSKKPVACLEEITKDDEEKVEFYKFEEVEFRFLFL